MTDDDLRRRLEQLSPAKRRLLEQKLRSRASTGPAELEAGPLGDGTHELSFAQERFWFLERLEPGNPAHHIPGNARLTGPLDLVAFERMVRSIVQRHEALRTVVDDAGERPRARVLPEIDGNFTVIDLRGLPPAERESERTRLVEKTILTPFDLRTGPLARMLLLRLGDETHEFVSCVHHIVSDGMSTQVFGEEMGLLYGPLARGEEPNPPPLPVQYRDWAAWQRRRLAPGGGGRHGEELAWWSERLADVQPIELPTDHPRRDDWRSLGRREGTWLSEATTAKLRRIARAEGATLFATMLAAFEACLHRWSGATDLAVGTTVANRGRVEVEKLFGFFVNTLVLRTDASGDPSFRELLRRVRRTSLEAQDHQEFPFEQVVDALQPERQLDRNPLFQVMFNFVDFEGWSRDLGEGLSMEFELLQSGTLFDLTLYATTRGERIRVELEYEASLFDPATVRRMVGHFETLLQGALDDLDRPLSRLPLLTGEERRALEGWGRGPARTGDGSLLLHERVLAQAEHTPGAPAVRAGDTTLTYAALARRSGEIAAGLRDAGAGPGSLVGVLVPRGPELLPALLGVARCGAAWVPLDPAFPPARLAFMAEDAGLDLVLTEGSLADRVPGSGRALLLEEIGSRAAFAPAPQDPEVRLYVIYTSGSTGQPKGVQVPHRSVVGLLESMLREPGLGPDDTLLAVTTLSFDIAVLELFGPLLAGGCVRIASPEDAADGARLAAALREPDVTVMQATPATWRMLRLAGWNGRRGLRAWCGGEALPRDLAEELLGCADEVWNLYGPTETTIWSTVARVRPGPVSIGRPIQGTTVRILDAAGQPVPAGVPGELWIAGDGVTLGYLDRPDLQAERFVDGAYRTGDLARWRTDGSLECFGRLDTQVKLRGYRIELGEIEEALRDHPAVQDAAAQVREDAPGDRRLVAFVAADEARDLEADLRRHLAERLPPWMVPSPILRLDALPRTPNGKLDRRALPEPGGRATERPTTPATTPTERALAEMWCEVLGIDTGGGGGVGADDDFFELGGHSLLATQLASRVGARFGVEMPLRSFFASPTLAALARAVDEAVAARAASGGEAPPAIAVSANRMDLPLSFAQERLWFLDRLGDGGAAYNMAGAVRMRGFLDADALERALLEVMRRHESLRTTFVEVDGRAVQVIAGEVPLPLARLELAGEAEVEALAREEALRPFDLGRGPLLRATLARIEGRKDDHVLVFVQHHIVSDGWSLGILVGELATLYPHFAAGEPAATSPLPELPIQVADFARWQRGWLTGAVLERHLAWWRSALEGAPHALELPTDRPRPPIQAHAGARRRHRLDGALIEQVDLLARAAGTSRFAVLLAAFQVLCGRLAGTDDVVVGTSIANRNRVETEGLIGFFVNTLPLRARLGGADLGGGESFRALLEQVSSTTLSALDHQDLPFEKLVEELRPARDLARQPLFQVTFDLLNLPSRAARLPGLAIEPIELDPGTSKYDLTVQLAPVQGDGSGGEGEDPLGPAHDVVIEYATALFDAATVDRWWSHYEVLLRAALADPTLPPARLPLVPEGERARLLEACAGAADAPPGPELLHRGFEQACDATPDAIAVRDGERRLTYAEAERRANRLAQRLRAAGVGADEPVGVCIGRSADLVVALLGILKAGAAYLPLDPAYPRARLALLLEDGGASRVVTRAADAACLPADTADAGIEQILLEEESELGEEGGDDTRPDVPIDPDDLAYVLYTSGSTGRPKGVAVPHRAVTHYVRWAREAYRLDGGGGAPLHSSVGFDLTVTSVFPVLAAGGTIDVVPAGEAGSGVGPLAATAGAARAEAGPYALVKLTPSHLAALAQELTAAQMRTWTRVLVVGGEALRASDLAPWRRHAPDTRIVNEYGPTEASVGCVVHRVEPGDPEEGTVAIGRPIAGVRAYVLDAELEPLPPGIPGDLWLAGPNLARGYLGDAQRTAERFLPDPFGGAAAGRMYRTGDRVRRDPDGTLRFLGRDDDQVKIRGHRVELGEVEATLARQAGVRDCAVVARTDAQGTRLVAYVVAATADLGADPGPDLGADLRAALLAELPEALVPAVFVPLDALPLTPHGKVDSAALPEPTREGLAGDDFAAPSTDAEATLAAIWAEVLGLERVGVRDNFFQLGGDSILSLQIVARAGREGLGITTRQVFEHQTVAELAAAAGSTAPVRAEQGPVVGPAELGPIQAWLLGRDLPQVNHWNQALLFDVAPGLEPEHLERALDLLARHHDLLRARFRREADGWRQEIAETPALRWAREDLRGVAPGALDKTITAACTIAQASLDLEAGVLQAVTWFDLPEGTTGPASRVLWAIHHLVVDGVSWRILLEDLSTTLAALRAGSAPELPPKTSSFPAWSRALGPANDGTPEVESSPPLPRDGTGENTEGAVEVHTIALDGELSAALHGPLHDAYRTRVDDFLAAALGLALAEWSGNPDVSLDLEGHGRDGAPAGIDVSRTVGWFTTIRPVRMRLSPGDAPRTVLRSVKEELRRLAGRPLAAPRSEVLLNYLGRLGAPDPGAPLVPRPDSGRLGGAPKGPANPRAHLLEVDARSEDGRLVADFRYAAGLHDAATVETLAASFTRHLRRLVDHARSPGAGGRTPSDFPLARLDQASLDRVLEVHPAPQDVLPLTATQQGMFFHSLYAPGTVAYVEQLVNVLEGDIDLGALRAAFDELVRRVDLLRACVVWEGLAEPLLVIQDEVELPWEESEAQDVPPSRRSAWLHDLAAEERDRPIDLGHAPLFRVQLVRMGARRFALAFHYHHLILDGWSMPLLLLQVLDRYEALRTGSRGKLPPPPAWRDHVAWLARRDEEEERAFWRGRLAGFRAATPVGFHGQRRAGGEGSGDFDECETFLPRDLSKRLRALGQGAGVTQSTLVQAAWALVLGSYSREDDVVFGATVSGRPAELARVEERIGLFINTVPVRVNLDRERGVLDWLRGLQALRTEELAFEHTPLLVSQSASDVPAGDPLFESIVVFENYPLDDALKAPPGGLSVVETFAFERTSYPLTLVAVPGERMLLRALYDRERFTADEAERLVHHVATALEAFTGAATARVGDLSLVPSLERQRLLYEWREGPPALAPTPAVHRRFLEQARRTPDAIAVVDGATTTTYAALAETSGRVAAHLAAGAEDGAGEEVIGLLLPRSTGALQALIGIPRAGAAWLPLDPSHPAGRIALALEDAGVRRVVTNADMAVRLPRGVEAVLLEDALAHSGPDAPDEPTDPASLAYVLTTSGSTGRPKGVAVEHRSLAHYTEVALREFALEPRDRVLQFASLAFDTSSEEIWPTLATGATLVLRTDAMLASPRAFAREMARSGVTLLDFPTAYWHELVAGLDEEAARDLGAVRTVILGGEAVRRERLARWRALFGRGVKLFNTYGPTEATIVSTLADLTAGPDDPLPDRVPIGRPIPGARVLVLDERLRPVPHGAPGELCIGGAGLARGYLNRPELTAERFVEDPFGTTESFDAGRPARLYRSGDLVRFGAGGELEFLGRLDDQVKVRGHRVELGEVEHALATHPDVAEVVVLLRRRAGAGWLAAYVVLRDGATPDPAALLEHAAGHLAEPMVPERLFVVDAIPRNTSGKADRGKLMEWGDAGPASSAEPDAARVEPRNEDERRVCAVFAEVFGLESVGAADDFFALGGNSLVAIRLMSRLEEELGAELALRDLFEGPTPAEIAATLAAQSGARPDIGPDDDLTRLRASRALDLPALADLEDDLRPDPAAGARSGAPELVFLTGATGFLGAFLLRELLDRTAATVACLVRAADEEAGAQRLEQALDRHGLWSEELRSRIRPVPGTLDQPRLGLPPEAFRTLGEDADLIVHSGAATSFFQPYGRLAAANVEGTREILRLACLGTPTPLAHVSTIGVFDIEGIGEGDTLREDADLADYVAVRGGYAQSKWVAERMVRTAGERGLPVRVLRPGRIVGSATSGAANADDFALQVFRMCLEFGVAPDLDLETDATPVDYVAAASVRIALEPTTAGGTFHLLNPTPFRPREAVDWLAAHGRSVRRVSGREWLAELSRRLGERPRHPFFPLLPMLAAAPELGDDAPDDPRIRGPRVDASATEAALAGTGITCPPIDGAFLGRLLARLESAGLLPSGG